MKKLLTLFCVIGLVMSVEVMAADSDDSYDYSDSSQIDYIGTFKLVAAEAFQIPAESLIPLNNPTQEGGFFTTQVYRTLGEEQFIVKVPEFNDECGLDSANRSIEELASIQQHMRTLQRIPDFNRAMLALQEGRISLQKANRLCDRIREYTDDFLKSLKSEYSPINELRSCFQSCFNILKQVSNTCTNFLCIQKFLLGCEGAIDYLRHETLEGSSRLSLEELRAAKKQLSMESKWRIRDKESIERYFDDVKSYKDEFDQHVKSSVIPAYQNYQRLFFDYMSNVSDELIHLLLNFQSVENNLVLFQTIWQHIKQGISERVNVQRFDGATDLFTITHKGQMYTVRSVYPSVICMYDLGAKEYTVYDLSNADSRKAFLSIKSCPENVVLIQKQPYAKGETLYDLKGTSILRQDFETIEDIEMLWAKAVITLHGQGYRHGDLHCNNVIKDQNILSIIDWSCSREDDNTPSSAVSNLSNDAAQGVLEAYGLSSDNILSPDKFYKFTNECFLEEDDISEELPNMFFIGYYSKELREQMITSGLFSESLDCRALNEDNWSHARGWIDLTIEWLSRYVDNRRDTGIFHKALCRYEGTPEDIAINEKCPYYGFSWGKSYEKNGSHKLDSMLLYLLGSNPFTPEPYDKDRVNTEIHQQFPALAKKYMDNKNFNQLLYITQLVEALYREQLNVQDLQTLLLQCWNKYFMKQLLLVRYFGFKPEHFRSNLDAE